MHTRTARGHGLTRLAGTAPALLRVWPTVDDTRHQTRGQTPARHPHTTHTMVIAPLISGTVCTASLQSLLALASITRPPSQHPASCGDKSNQTHRSNTSLHHHTRPPLTVQTVSQRYCQIWSITPLLCSAQPSTAPTHRTDVPTSRLYIASARLQLYNIQYTTCPLHSFSSPLHYTRHSRLHRSLFLLIANILAT